MTFKFLKEEHIDNKTILTFATDRGVFSGTAILKEGEKINSKYVAYQIAESKAYRAYLEDKLKEYMIQKKTYEYIINAIESKKEFYEKDTEYICIMKNYKYLLYLIEDIKVSIEALSYYIKYTSDSTNTMKNRAEQYMEYVNKRRKAKEDFIELEKKIKEKEECN